MNKWVNIYYIKFANNLKISMQNYSVLLYYLAFRLLNKHDTNSWDICSIYIKNNYNLIYNLVGLEKVNNRIYSGYILSSKYYKRYFLFILSK